MKVDALIKKYLKQGRMMQVATVSGDQPWICTVYYVEDAKQNLYWLSTPARRHSQEIAKHSQVAVAVPIKVNKPVIGLQAEGTAGTVDDPKTIAKIMKSYVERYNSGKDFYDNFISGKNQHQLYYFTPKTFVLFDEVTFAGDARKEWSPR